MIAARTIRCPNCNHSIVRPTMPVGAGLTRMQKQALDAIHGAIAANGYSPSYAEIGLAIGLKSKSGVLRLVGGLLERGYITFIPAKQRSIALTEKGVSIFERAA